MTLGPTIRELAAGADGPPPEVVDDDSPLTPLEEVAEEIGAGPGVDPLEALLGIAPNTDITDEVTIERLGTVFTIKAIPDDEEYEKLQERCTDTIRRRRGIPQEKLNWPKFRRTLVAEYTLDPPFHPKYDDAGYRKLAEHHGATDPTDLVRRALLPGEVDLVADRILQLSGFGDPQSDMVEAGKG